MARVSRTDLFIIISLFFLLEFTWSSRKVTSNTTTNKVTPECTNNDNICNITRMLSKLLVGYDKRLRPFINEQKPVTITCGFWILSIDSINVMDMDYRIDLFMRQAWEDPRLATHFSETLTVSNAMLDKIWIPDTYFENSKHSNFHAVTVANKMLRIDSDGTIHYNARISVRASCPMDLRLFPVDSQTCNLQVDSYGYSNKDIRYEWENSTKRILLDDKVKQLPQYNLSSYNTLNETRTFVAGNWSGLKFQFTLDRRYEYFFLHLYAPCAMIVMLSWISFFIRKDVIPARIALGITAVLTTTTILNIQNNSMPKVSYIKLADWYLIISFLFIFAVLIEYTIVLYLTEQTERRKKIVEEYKTMKKNAKNDRFGQNDKKTLRSQSCRPPVLLLLEGRKKKNNAMDSDDELEYPFLGNMCQGNFNVDKIDEYSRWTFPLAFFIFNTIYWIYFFSEK